MRLDLDSGLATYADYMGLGIFLEVTDRHRINMRTLWTENVDGRIFKHSALPNSHTLLLQSEVSSLIGQPGICVEVPEKLLVRRLRSGHRLHQQTPSDKTSFPRLSQSAKGFVAIAARTCRIDSYFIGSQLSCHLGRQSGVIAGDGRDERTVRYIHFVNQLVNAIDHQKCIDWSEGLQMIKRAMSGYVE